MNRRSFLHVLLLALAGSFLTTGVHAAPVVTELQARAQHGQVFLTWGEAETPAGTTFNVYVASAPIRDVATAVRIGHHVEPRSAKDWWETKSAFTKKATDDQVIGFRLGADSMRLNPDGGLFVHTITAAPRGPLFFAVTATRADGTEDRTLAAGANATTNGLAASPGAIEPIWQGKGAMPPGGAGAGKPLSLSLHGKSGVIAESEYLVFGDATMGWREGLPFKFSVRIEGGEVVIRPTDRAWINRSHDEASDGGAPAIWTFWYGYNSHIYDRALMPQGRVFNYTEQRLLWMLDWVQRHYQTDRNRWYCSGSSMGGCGTISFGLRHPELFAACDARVPIVNYTYVGKDPRKGSASRLEPAAWTGLIRPEVLTNEGVPLLERMNSTQFVTKSTADLPFLFILNGRQDGSIPWVNNPPFYRAMDAAHQGFAAYWDDGTHPTAGKVAPDDIKSWSKAMRRFRLNESFPAFSATSANRDPGHGDPKEGDIIGWMNRGMDWSKIEDEADHYAITLKAEYPGVTYPIRTDVTLRRVQRFKTKPGEQLRVDPGNGTIVAVTADANGRVTVPAVSIPNREGIRLVIRRG